LHQLSNQVRDVNESSALFTLNSMLKTAQMVVRKVIAMLDEDGNVWSGHVWVGLVWLEGGVWVKKNRERKRGSKKNQINRQRAQQTKKKQIFPRDKNFISLSLSLSLFLSLSFSSPVSYFTPGTDETTTAPTAPTATTPANAAVALSVAKRLVKPRSSRDAR
jgi:hypothetical protein